MNHEDIKPHAVTEALKDLPDTFRTKHVSEHPAMLAVHDSSDYEYHKSVGRYLSVYGHKHGVRKDPSRSQGAKGQAWIKSTSNAMRTDVGGVPAERSTSLFGPQHSGDAPFTARMRFHQSHYRATVLRVACGTGPTESDPRSFGNMLLRVDGTAGLNFLTPEIFRVARRRLAQSSDRVERYRLLHNMLSSQPMCFNLFAPLVDDLERAGRMIGALLPGEVARVSKVAIEYAPEPAHEYLHDRTSFDAFVEYERPDGKRAILGIETKLTDSFSPKRYDKPEYRRWMKGSRSPWRPEAHEEVASERLNQIWRDHLLAIAMRDRSGSPYSTCRMLIVHHPLDRDAAAAIESYGSLLSPGNQTFAGVTIGEVVERFESVAVGEAELEWLRKFRQRYLDLAESEEAWGQRLTSRPFERSAAVAEVPLNEASTRSDIVSPYSAHAIREGHLNAVAMLEDLSSFEETRRLYEHHLGVANVYFRPTEKGFTVMSLDFERCASMIGVSDRDTSDEYLTSIPPSPDRVATAYAGYCSKRDSLARRSGEERFALRCIRGALANGLQLHQNPEWFFVHQEWRFPSGFDVGKLDLLVVDPSERRLVVIELKGSAAKASVPDKRGRIAEEQAAAYADLLVRHREELYPFFERLARAMATAYGGPEAMKTLKLDPALRPKTAVWWPT